MRYRSIIIALIIILIPFLLGIFLFISESRGEIYPTNHFISDTKNSNTGLEYKGVKIDWAFCPNWQYKPLLFPAGEYLVFVFHYKNNTNYDIELTPSYAFISPSHRRYAANEEIAMYIEDDVEDELKVTDETSMSYKITSGSTKHYIATFEKPDSLDKFYIDVNIFRDVTVRIHYKKENGFWNNCKNEFVNNYKGRG